MVTMKLKISPSAFARLFEALESEENPFQVAERRNLGEQAGDVGEYIQSTMVNFVRILPGERKFDGRETEVTLELMDKRLEVVGVRNNETTRPVDREMIDKLLDLLEIFPRGKKQ